MELFDIGSPTYAYGTDNPDWKADSSKLISNLNLGVTDYGVLLTTHKTLRTAAAFGANSEASRNFAIDWR